MATDKDKLAMLSEMQFCSVTSDFTIIADGLIWKVHRFVLAMHSDVLKAMCSGDFKEATEMTLDWSEYHEDVITAFVEYMYNFNYDAKDYESAFSSTPAIHVHLAVLADKYNIPLLQNLAVTKVKATLEHKCKPKDFAEAAALSFDFGSPTENIKSVIVDMIVNDQSPTMSGELEATMLEYPDLAVQVTKKLRVKARDKTASAPPGAPRASAGHAARI
ncbi:unnamed protein product [Zymoseptoria tritici ST99CH_1A5]|uniref:BTB domain-containing protein n=1 Tax=Zymoseptoria tritici ST99CH_1A5 TaxID=1276529 RepID=A0A1Y6LJY5_ZYMTR|nr:unnamed protein product [Zymoseptoria tritici ST99CH_1A5]